MTVDYVAKYQSAVINKISVKNLVFITPLMLVSSTMKFFVALFVVIVVTFAAWSLGHK